MADGIFNRSIFNNAIFNTGTGSEEITGGGYVRDSDRDKERIRREWQEHYEELYERTIYQRQQDLLKEQYANATTEIERVEEQIIELKKDAQDLTLQRQDALNAKTAIERMQAEMLALRLEQLDKFITMQNQQLLQLRNQQALVVLMMAYPFMNITGAGSVH